MTGFIKRWLLRLLMLALLLPILLVWAGKSINPPVWGWQLHREWFPPPGYPPRSAHLWVPMEAISTNAQLAVVASEDQHFPDHYGFDINAILAILKQTGREGPSRGGSTITQQTAKNLFLFPSRTFLRKGVELYFALWMELLWDKSRILEVYLNIVEFGPGLFGVEAASQTFFGIPARRLSAQQAAQLAAVLPNPYRMQPAPMSPYIQQRSQWIRQQMRQLGPQTLNKLKPLATE
ncbi:monofunctional biosynthetic peptidoglycan transglycosylase [Photobacterium lutimaris]|uniref:Biosynthetic peptidoglycan transglycosylase n=1 Tax=Photobacterium lutimaris TaxID=388278 RepID=A0A2T3IV24_9GAMM|nr:monofunctional biosynthetic peptidoglycan transglycosylase [Photobacterium lutimaris]PSU32220.1 monofunctional biosynthetic peptidoglycan transglycosylase [Photobacterium lutimaris]TDR70484.1 monofunctional biosynthetic peptidoglycan transglycosylase [Photobacterium lutimaris]